MELKLNLRENSRHNQPYYCYGSRPLLCANHLKKVFPDASSNIILYIYTEPKKISDEQEINVYREACTDLWSWKRCQNSEWLGLGPAACVFIIKLIPSRKDQTANTSICDFI
jgi:hypothetical protein